jgi:hypothetical protein
VDFVAVAVLAALGVGTSLIFVIKAMLDLLPDLFTSWHRAVAAYKGDMAEPSPDSKAGEGNGDVDSK